MALGTTTAILLGLGAAGAGYAASKSMANSAPKLESPKPLPQPPSPEASVEKAEDTVRKRRAMSSQSIYTSPLGATGQANIAKKTLLGQ